MAKADVSQEPDYSAAILEHFKALSFDQQTHVLKEIQAVFKAQAETQREELLSRLRELDELAGRPVASASQKAGDAEGRTRGSAPIKYYDPATGDKSTGRGSMAGWLKAKKEAGVDIDTFLVSVDNPLPETLV